VPLASLSSLGPLVVCKLFALLQNTGMAGSTSEVSWMRFGSVFLELQSVSMTPIVGRGGVVVVGAADDAGGSPGPAWLRMKSTQP